MIAQSFFLQLMEKVKEKGSLQSGPNSILFPGIFCPFFIVLSKEQTLCYCLASSEKQILWVLRQVPNILRFRTLAMFNYLIRIKRKIYGMTRERRHLNSMGKESYFKAKQLAASPEVTSSQKLET